jgi:hypothetical protein
MKTYILFFIVFLLSFSAYSQTGGGMRRGDIQAQEERPELKQWV